MMSQENDLQQQDSTEIGLDKNIDQILSESDPFDVTESERKAYKRSIWLYIFVLLLASAAAVLSISAIYFYSRDFLRWDSTLEEFRTDAEIERAAFHEEMNTLMASEEDKLSILTEQRSSLENEIVSLRETISGLSSEAQRGEALQSENNTLEAQNEELTQAVNELQTTQV